MKIFLSTITFLSMAFLSCDRDYNSTSSVEKPEENQEKKQPHFYSNRLYLSFPIPDGFEVLTDHKADSIKQSSIKSAGWDTINNEILQAVIKNRNSLAIVKKGDFSNNIFIQGLPKTNINESSFAEYQKMFTELPQKYPNVKEVIIMDSELSTTSIPKYMYFKTQTFFTDNTMLKPSEVF